MKISINLLPPEKKKLLHKEVVLRIVTEQLVYAGIILFVLLVGLYTVHIILRMDIAAADRLIKKQEQVDAYRDVQGALDVFRETNTQIRNLRHLQQGHITWTDLLQELSAAIPQSVRLTEIEVKNSQLQLRGIAKTRDDVVFLKKTLESVAINDRRCFEDVTIPEKDLVIAKEGKFSAELSLTEGCLRASLKK